MARPKKTGLDYFPLDCQMDDKVEMLEAEHGLEGFAVYLKLLQHIYQTEAGELDMSVVFRWKTLAKQWGIPPENFRKIVDTMLEVALFDKTAFAERQVLTSNGIQKRLSEVAALRAKDRRRKTDGEPEFSDGKPPEKYTKGKGKDTNVSKKETQKESSLHSQSAGEGEKKNERRLADDEPPAAQPTSPPVALPPPRQGYRDFTDDWPVQLLPPFRTPAFHTAWARYAGYRHEIGKAFGGEISEQEALNTLSRFAAGDAQRALCILSNNITQAYRTLTNDDGSQSTRKLSGPGAGSPNAGRVSTLPAGSYGRNRGAAPAAPVAEPAPAAA